MKTPKRIRILLADDHSVVRQGLRSLFKYGSEFQIVGEAANGEEAVRLATKLSPDVVVMDISMPKLNGIEATLAIRKQDQRTRILILTIHEDESYVKQLVALGANGYVLKNAEKDELFSAVRAVMVGGQFYSPGISNTIRDGLALSDGGRRGSSGGSDMPLTRRETEILGYVARGFTSKAIASKLFISLRTVNTHRSNIMHKLKIHDTAGLVRYAINHGLASADT